MITDIYNHGKTDSFFLIKQLYDDPYDGSQAPMFWTFLLPKYFVNCVYRSIYLVLLNMKGREEINLHLSASFITNLDLKAVVIFVFS